ncbi:MAG: sulfite exporter TauE/SafE family protein [Myxococcales bacterium]|nr:sulfite exporter TauE/SafE family protein [Myxococcales bacterium]
MLDVIDPIPLVVLLVAGVVAGFVNTLAGGGSLLTLPALMLAGLPADVANGTNRVAVVSQSIAGVLAFRRAGRLTLDDAFGLFAPTVLGALCGALVAAYLLPRAWVEPVLLGTMITMAFVMLVRPKAFEAAEGDALRVRQAPLGALGLFGAGVYGGFVQAGVGFVLLAVLGGVLRYDLVRANAVKMLGVLAFTSIALTVFVIAGQVAWIHGALLSVGTVLGSHLGVRTALDVKPRTLRLIVFVGVVAASVAALWR